MIRLFTGALFFVCLVQSSYAESASQQGTLGTLHELHQVEEVAPYQFRFNKGDPYIVYKFPAGNSASLPALLFDDLESTKPLSGQIFWSPNEAAFSQNNSIRFENVSLNKIYLDLGDQFQQSKWLRLDLDDCPCEVALKNPVKLVADKKFNDYALPNLEELNADFFGFDIALEKLSYRQLRLNTETGYAEYKGYDPQVFILPPNEISLDIAAGIYLDFEFESSNKHDIFEIFWLFRGTTNYQKRTAYFAFPSENKSRHSAFIPFSELRSTNRLKGIRFDPTTCKTCKLKFHKIRVVGKVELAEYQQYEPEKLVFAYTDQTSRAHIFSSFLQKFSKDFGFMLFYISLLILLVFLIAKPKTKG